MPRKTRNLPSGYSFAKDISRRRRRPQPDRTGGVSSWLGFISQIRLQLPTPKNLSPVLFKPRTRYPKAPNWLGLWVNS